MKSRLLFAACLGVFCHMLVAGVAHGQPTGSIVGWGSRVVVEPSALLGVVKLAAGSEHSLGVKSDTTIAAWGKNLDGQCNVPSPDSVVTGQDTTYTFRPSTFYGGTTCHWKVRAWNIHDVRGRTRPVCYRHLAAAIA